MSELPDGAFVVFDSDEAAVKALDAVLTETQAAFLAMGFMSRARVEVGGFVLPTGGPLREVQRSRLMVTVMDGDELAEISGSRITGTADGDTGTALAAGG